MTVAKRLKEFRTVKRLTALEVAKTLDIPARTVGSYERGEVLPGTKFYDLMIQKYDININWLITGIGKMFINDSSEKNNDSISQLQEEIKLSNEDMKVFIELLKSEAGRNMLLKFIAIKHGSKEALDSLIENLQGIRAVF